MSIRNHYKTLRLKVPDIINKAARHSHPSASIISLKNVHNPKGRGKGRGDNILMIAITGEKVNGKTIIAAITGMADIALFIAGRLYEMKILSPALGTDREHLQNFAVAADWNLVKSQRIIMRDCVMLGQTAIGRAAHISMAISDCQGVIPILTNGCINPSFNFLLTFTRRNVGLTAAAITAAVTKAYPELSPPATNLPAPDFPDYGAATGHVAQRRSTTESLVLRLRNQGRGGTPRSGPHQGRDPSGRGGYRKGTTSLIERRIMASHRYHVLVYPQNGIFWAGVYYGHWMLNNGYQSCIALVVGRLMI